MNRSFIIGSVILIVILGIYSGCVMKEKFSFQPESKADTKTSEL